ncbi:MAG: flagellar biosynthesis anti-sigma factor FlgM [Saccharospirillaceae bacterium]|nr:flagellar biosynthesis anti-sigma factor FlgM [Pseudomonadales bacterium]NRB80218.1 flagellar biosynthesis anti-sigma factor FlgM [Saccharospirillaceae bacterium]
MAININGLNNNSHPAGRTKSVDSDVGGPKKTNSESTGQDTSKVSLSTAAQNIKKIEDNIRAMPIVDQTKVDNIKSAIKNGEYEIDYERLATAFINFESEA